jgi:hypothetical protein
LKQSLFVAIGFGRLWPLNERNGKKPTPPDNVPFYISFYFILFLLGGGGGGFPSECRRERRTCFLLLPFRLSLSLDRVV